MKRAFIACLFLVLFTVGCNKSGYVITGNIGDSTLVDHNIYLSDLFNESVLDTAVINSDGSFEFNGNLGADVQPFLAKISVELSDVGAILVLENGKINVDFDFIDGSYIPTIKGTPLNAEIASLDSRSQVSRDTLMSKLSTLESNSLLLDDEASEKQQQYINEYISDFRGICNDVFNKNKDNVVGLFALLNWSSIDRDINLDSLLECSGDVIKNNETMKMQVEAINKAKATRPGNPFIDLSGLDYNGNPVSLSNYAGKGKLVLIDFWASWCEPCKAEIPNIAKIAKKYADQVIVVGLNVWDQPDKFKEAYVEEKISWPQIVDENKQAFTDAYGVDAIPQIILIGKDGTILARDLRGEAIENAIAEALSK